MKLLAVFAIGVIALIGSPALSDSERHKKPLNPLTALECYEIAQTGSTKYRGHKKSAKNAQEIGDRGISARIREQLKSSTKNAQDTDKSGMTAQIREQLKTSNLFSGISTNQLLEATQMATIYLAFCK